MLRLAIYVGLARPPLDDFQVPTPPPDAAPPTCGYVLSSFECQYRCAMGELMEKDAEMSSLIGECHLPEAKLVATEIDLHTCVNEAWGCVASTP